MATKKTTEETVTIEEGYEIIRAPYGKPTDQDIIIGINGVNTLIPRDGKEHKVKAEVAYEYNRSLEAERKMFEHQSKLAEESKIV